MRRNAALVTMLALEAAVLALAGFVYLRSRVAILAAFRDFGTELPAAPAVALSAWFLPAAALGSVFVTLVGLLAPVRPRRRALAVGVGLFVSSAALVFAVTASFLAVFRVV